MRGQSRFRAHRGQALRGSVLLGIDEETAVIGRDGGWQVHGAARVTGADDTANGSEPATPSEFRKTARRIDGAGVRCWVRASPHAPRESQSGRTVRKQSEQ